MLTIHVWPKWVKEFLLTHPLYKSPPQKRNVLRQSLCYEVTHLMATMVKLAPRRNMVKRIVKRKKQDAALGAMRQYSLASAFSSR